MGAVKKVVSRALFEGSSDAAEKNQGLPKRAELLPSSALFPRQLLELKAVPKKLYALGDVSVLSTPGIAIVGARKATSYGLECAQRFAHKAATWGVTVVSGGAIGCDMAAHQGALDAGGSTIVVLGSGADVAYPLRARDLFKEVLATGGALLSEAPWGSPPLSWAFSKRNRIIAALSQATLIVEAGLPSGTFQTADHTLALGNEVLVVPGSIFSKEFKGSNRLIAQGAIPIVDDESFEDALTQIFGPRNRMAQLPDFIEAVHDSPGSKSQELQLSQESQETQESHEAYRASLSPEELKLYHLTQRILTDLRANPLSIDALALAYNRDTVELIRVISRLEISGQLERLRDGRFMAKPG